jgi:DNA helicase-2/ATP-dependent DNA helicase PcrA
MQEERRLLYVGITRARDRLFLIFSQSRNLYGFAEPSEPSPFLEDVPYHLTDQNQPTRSQRVAPASREYRADRWEAGRTVPRANSSGAGGSFPNASAPVIQPRYSPGMRVVHNVWGDGMVLNTRIQDDDEIVDIFFENVGLKRVAASLARLEVKK